VGLGGVAHRPELGEVAAGAEGRAGAPQHDEGGRPVRGAAQRVGERVAHVPVEGVADVRPVQRDGGDEPFGVDDDRVVALLGATAPGLRPPLLQPALELRARLQEAVDGRLGEQPGRHVLVGPAAQELRHRQRRLGVLLDRHDELEVHVVDVVGSGHHPAVVGIGADRQHDVEGVDEGGRLRRQLGGPHDGHGDRGDGPQRVAQHGVVERGVVPPVVVDHEGRHALRQRAVVEDERRPQQRQGVRQVADVGLHGRERYADPAVRSSRTWRRRSLPVSV
jgi:hypothetical protein